VTAKILLTLALLGVWLYALVQSGLARVLKMGLYAVIAVGVFFVWVPDVTSVIANAMGIGRGADLIFYVWIVLSFGVILNLHLKLKENLTLLTELARHIAIAQPYRLPDQFPSGDGEPVLGENSSGPRP
jgi:hypothetical protein